VAYNGAGQKRERGEGFRESEAEPGAGLTLYKEDRTQRSVLEHLT